MRELASWVYRILRSKLLGALVILAMAVLALLGTLITQEPAGSAADPVAHAAFLESMQPRYGGWTAVLEFLGIFNLWVSPIFLGVTVLLALSIIACTVHRLPQLWRRATEPRVHVTAKFFDRAQYRATIVVPMTPAASLEHVGSVLKGRRYRLLPDERLDGGDAVGMFADRFRWGPFGTAVAHAAMVVILAAFAVSALTGFDESLDIAVGESVPVGHDTGLSVTAVSFKDSYDESGRPLDYVSHLVVERDSQVVAEQDVRVNEPLGVGATAFHQASYGIAAAVRIDEIGGNDLFLGAVALKWQSNDGRYAIGKVTPGETGIEVLIVTPASGATDAGISAGSAVFELYDIASGERVDVLPVEQGETVESVGLSLTFERELRYTGIIARQDPGAPWMWVGSTLLIVGMCVTFMARHRRLWVRCSPEGTGSLVQIASAEKLDSTFERHFRGLVAQIDATAPTDPAGGVDDDSDATEKEELIDA